ncbi:MAG: endonuclease/exonuclease/phosphatase family protein [Candidatus Aphodosoma sp.]
MHSVTSYILYVITGIILAFYGLGCVAPYIPPDVMTIPAYFGLAFPLFWCATVAICFVACIVRRWKLAGITVLCLALSYGEWHKTISLRLQPDKAESDDTDRTVSLLTYNVEMFNGSKDLKSFVEYIRETDADIVCLQEFGFYNRALSQSDILGEFDKLYPYRHLWYKNQSSRSSSGLATFSRFPIVKKEKIQYRSEHNISIFSDIDINGDTIRVLNNHLESNKLNSSDKNLASLLDENTPRDAKIKHTRRLQTKLGTAMKIRARQAEAIRYTISRTRYPVIVAGDFNDVPQSYTYRIIASGLNDAYIKAGKPGYYWTYNSSFMYFPIDHILFSPSLKATKAAIHRTELSDHYPLTATIKIK